MASKKKTDKLREILELLKNINPTTRSLKSIGITIWNSSRNYHLEKKKRWRWDRHVGGYDILSCMSSHYIFLIYFWNFAFDKIIISNTKDQIEYTVKEKDNGVYIYKHTSFKNRER